MNIIDSINISNIIDIDKWIYPKSPNFPCAPRTVGHV